LILLRGSALVLELLNSPKAWPLTRLVSLAANAPRIVIGFRDGEPFPFCGISRRRPAVPPRRFMAVATWTFSTRNLPDTVARPHVVGLFILSVAVVIWRRPDQIAAPILWFEEGTHILRRYGDCGLCALFSPINGNIALSAKILLLPALKISALSAPPIAAALGILFNAAVVCAIATAPTHLKAKYLCAISALFIPTGTENYGTALYSVWWSGILIALALLWDTSKGLSWLRLAFLVAGGLSTPLMIVAGPLFVVRAYREQTANEFPIVLTAGALALVAALVAVSWPATAPLDPDNLTADAASLTVSKFFGLYLAPAATFGFVPGLLLIVAIISLAYHERRKLDFFFFLLAALLAASIAAILVRSPVADIDPFGAGGRYFFLPYIFMSFMLLWLWSLIDTTVPLLKAAPLVIIGLAIAGGMQQSYFIHPVQDRKPWSVALSKCASTASDTQLPLGYNWKITIPPQQCRTLIDDSLVR
jgi:hypothetical protein